MLPLPNLPWAKIGIAVGALAVFAAGVYFVYSLGKVAGYDASESKWLKRDLERQQAYQRELEARDAKLATAQAYADSLVSVIMKRDEELEQTKKEHQDAIKKLTTGRPCLSGELVGVLNSGGNTPVPPAQSNSGGQPAAGEAATRVATDTDIALWVAEVRPLYAQCVSRLEAWQTLYQEKKLCQ